MGTFDRPNAWLRLGVLVLLAIASSPSAAVAQTGESSRISGIVRDASQGVVPGATIEVKHEGTGLTRTTYTDETGSYVVPNLPVGSYVVTVSLEGFTTVVHPGILLQVDQEARVDAVLTVGGFSESTVVTAETPMLETRSSTLKNVVDRERMSELPLNGRNPLELTLFVPGVQATPAGSAGQSSVRPDQTFISSSGGRGNTVLYALDGGDNSDNYTNAANVYPNPDALQEFSVQTNNFTAEYGRRLGGVVNAITRSGTNDLTGSLFEYLRNDSLNASNYFTPGEGDGLKRNQYGGALGGPIIRNRTFFFVSFQGTRIRQRPAERTSVVPTAAMRAGDFSDLRDSRGNVIVVRDPLTGQPFPNNRIPASRFDPVAAKLLQYIPVPEDAAGRVQTRMLNNTDDDQFLVKVDQDFGSSTRLGVRYLFDTLSRDNPMQEDNYLASARLKDYVSQNLSVTATRVFSPHLLGVAGFTLNRVRSEQTYGYPQTLAELGSRVYDMSANKDMELSVSGFFSIPNVAGGVLTRQNLQYQAGLTWVRARHELKFGADLMQQRLDMPPQPYYSNGSFTFAGQFTGSNLTDFMLGLPSAFTQISPQTEDLRAFNPGFYVQDTFRASSNLTLNLGLRYEPFFPWVDDKYGVTAVWRAGEPSQVAPGLPPGLLVGGDPGVSKAGYPSSWTQLDPRLGLAYALPNGRTSVRAGYGLFHEFPNSIVSNRISLSPPYAVRVDIQKPRSLSDPFAGTVNPFPTTIPAPASYVFPRPVAATFYADDFSNAYAHQWNASIEHQITDTWLARISYVGAALRNLMQSREMNPGVYGPGASLSNVNQRRPLYPNYSNLWRFESTGRSNYQAVAFGAERRLKNSYSVKASYTYGRSMDYASTATAGGIHARYTNPADPEYDWGPSDFDRRHRFVGTVVWTLPQPTGSSAVVRAFAGDWQASAIVVLESGQPFSVTAGSDRSLDGEGNDRPDQVADPSLPSDRSVGDKVRQWFDTSAFRLNAPGTFGSAARNSLRGPGTANVNLALVKTIPVGGVKAQFRAEVFNLFNRPNFNNPNTNLSSPLFGQITSAQDPRIIQLAIRAVF